MIDKQQKLTTNAEKSLILFSAGSEGKQLKDYFLKKGRRISFFCDNDKNKWGTLLDGIKIIPPTELININLECSEIVICSSSWSHEISKQLRQMGIDRFQSFPLTYKNEDVISKLHAYPVQVLQDSSHTDVDLYWSEHTVNGLPFATAQESLEYLEWRFNQYPLCREFMELWGSHDGKTILDYGCGPGNDLIGFLTFTKARRVIGMDVSPTALDLSRIRLALHDVDPSRVELINVSDGNNHFLPLADESIDFINCSGVLMHTSSPEDILREFQRVLHKQGKANVMIYNKNSIWFHLYTAYEKMIIGNSFPGLSVEEAFSKNTDGNDCPIARCWSSDEFVKICKDAGFTADYVGGYFSLTEFQSIKNFLLTGLKDERLAAIHRQFLSSLTYDSLGRPLYQGKYAGIGGVYHLTK